MESWCVYKWCIVFGSRQRESFGETLKEYIDNQFKLAETPDCKLDQESFDKWLANIDKDIEDGKTEIMQLRARKTDQWKKKSNALQQKVQGLVNFQCLKCAQRENAKKKWKQTG